MTHLSHQVPWISGTIPLQLVSGKNQRRLVRRGKNGWMFIKKPKALEFMAYPRDRAWEKIESNGEPWPWTFPVVLTARCYYASRRPDLDVALLMDWLQARGIIKNDRQCMEQHCYKFLDPKNPRTEWQLRAFVEHA